MRVYDETQWLYSCTRFIELFAFDSGTSAIKCDSYFRIVISEVIGDSGYTNDALQLASKKQSLVQCGVVDGNFRTPAP